jgi:transposase
VNDRQVLNRIFWIMRTGAAWQELPDRYASPATCHRRFQEWSRAHVFDNIIEALARELEERGNLDLSECFIDGTFVPAKKGASVCARPSGAKIAKSRELQTALAFLSPFTYRVPRRMKSPLLNGRLQPERLNAWLQNARRVVVRYDYDVNNYLGFVRRACVRVLLKRYF